VNPNQSLWMQADVDALVAGIKGNGVISGIGVTWSSGWTFNVAAGSIYVSGSTVSVSSTSVSVLQANGGRHRLDLIVVNSSGVVSAVQGNVSLTPTAPSLPANSLLLATVFVPAGATALSADRVVDKRVMVTAGSGTGSVTSVALSAPNILSVSGSPVLTTGTLALSLASQTQNLIFAAPNGSSGTPTFRAMVNADLPFTVLPVANGGTGITTFSWDHTRNTPLTTPSSVATGDLWIEASGTSPSRTISVILRDADGTNVTLFTVVR